MPGVPASYMRTLWRRMPDRFAVTYRQRTSTAPAYTDYATVTDAWRRPLRTAEGGPSLGRYVRHDSEFYFPQSQLAVSPAPGDLLVRDAVSWTVLEASEAGALGAWRLACVRLAIQDGTTVNITRPTVAANDAGMRLTTPTSTVASGVSAGVQTLDDGAEDVAGARQIPKRVRVYLATPASVQAQDIVTDTVTGLTYAVLSVANPDRLDELQALDCQRIT